MTTKQTLQSLSKRTTLKPFAAIVLATSLSWAGTSMAADTAQQAVDVINAHGYVSIDKLKREHGLWTAKATTNDGVRVNLLVDANDQLLEVGRPDSQHNMATAQQVAQHVQQLGYQRVHDVKFDDGFWEAEAYNQAGFDVDLTLHPITLAVLSEVVDGLGSATPGVGNDYLSAAQVRSALEANGYSRIHDLEFDDGRWEADATNAAGQRVELRIDPTSGAVLRKKLDY
ncbi:PepSY domain-containing protein [Lampropedia aestuarii]|uniref:PepSY domain-containing protein n=1 Tax=Lampropedia aestuarii TaxID=2562762 RepID=UPI00246852D3|nr:PepSY domain-containing protein [Lampropedia aestuarii]MDH5859217.1 PepSY domain-containing protein [Lampropedia aestuarii]